MSPPTIQCSYPAQDIALLTFDMPGKGANVLSTSVLTELDTWLTELQARTDLVGLILFSGKPGQFVAGADLREFLASLDVSPEAVREICRRGQRIFQRLSSLPFVTIAAVHGACLGGGAELAAWCDRRVLTNDPKTQFGFPEVKLGLYPGWGGNIRAPRVVGLGNAVEMITGGEPLTAKQAFNMGWASDLVPMDRLLEAAIDLAREEHRTQGYLQDRQRWSAPVAMSPAEISYLGATASAKIQQQTRGNYPAPMAALETMLAGATEGIDAACQREAEGFARIFGSPVNRALLNVFFLTDANKKDRGVASADVQGQEVRSVSVVGAGLMGSGIAAANLKRGLRVFLYDNRPDVVSAAVGSILREAAFDRETKQPDPQKMSELAGRLQVCEQLEMLAQADLVIEAVVEQFQVKREVLRNLAQRMPSRAVLATNTSSISVSQLAEGIHEPQRFCGIHFFNPVRQMQLVEVVRGRETDDETVATAVKYVKALGKTAIVVQDGPGFVVNRLLLPYLQEAIHLIHAGVAPVEVDQAAKRFGMPMGPIELLDLVGLDTALYSAQVMTRAFPDRFQVPELLASLVEHALLGQKSQAGFYSYPAGKADRRELHPRAVEVINRLGRSQIGSIDANALCDRLFLPMVLEAVRLIEERVVRSPRDVDLAMILGTGFPPFRGGPLFWADAQGLAALVGKAQTYESCGPQFRVPPLLQQLAQDGRKFYD